MLNKNLDKRLDIIKKDVLLENAEKEFFNGYYETAATFFRNAGEHEKAKKCLILAAEQYIKKGSYSLAAMLFEEIGMYEKAAECYKKIGKIEKEQEMYKKVGRKAV
ncbi:MAG: hypothetical protein QW244_02130 [Candidatus Pacearchaeota archaeon]